MFGQRERIAELVGDELPLRERKNRLLDIRDDVRREIGRTVGRHVGPLIGAKGDPG
jgi:hypothetical protein